MTKLLTQRFRAALREATASVRALAEEAEYSGRTFDVYLNRHPPSREAALALAEVLEHRAMRLQVHASRLREAASDDPRGTHP